MPRGVNRLDEAMLQRMLWTPAIVRPSLWLDAADISTITIATGVSEWRDKSGNGRHFAQGVAANQPGLAREALNGRSVVRYDGSNDALSRTAEAWMYGYPLTIVSVFFARAWTNAYNGLFGFYTDSGGATAGYGFFIKDNSRSALYTVGTAGQPNYDGIGAVTYSLNAAQMSVADLANSALASWGNGASDGSNTSAFTLRTAPAASTTVTIGSDARFSRFTNWDIAETLILPRLSTADRQKLEGYLAWKWGITLTASHPYANRPPLIGD